MQQQQTLQQLVDQQSLEKQKQMVELLHASKGAEALGVLVQYLVFNVSIVQSFFLHAKKEQWNLITEPHLDNKMQIERRHCHASSDE